MRSTCSNTAIVGHTRSGEFDLETPKMNERLRMEYLDAMGISMFVPRRILPGAKASMRAVLPQTQNAEVDSAGAQALAERPVQQKQEAPAEPRQIHTAVDDIMESFSRPARADAPPEPEPAPKSSAVVNEPPVQFALSIWRPTPALMILDTRHAGGALPTQALLENILRAKGVSLPPNKPDILMWPPGSVAPTPGWDAPREMLQAFLQARLERQPAQYLWLMGESACRAVFADRPFQDSIGMAINLDALASLAVILPSLADMLQQPSLKARTWAAIRAHHVR